MVWWSSHGLPTKAVQFGLMSQVNIGFRGELEGEGKGLCDFNADCSQLSMALDADLDQGSNEEGSTVRPRIIGCSCSLFNK